MPLCRLTPAVLMLLMVSAFGSVFQGLLALADVVVLNGGGANQPGYLLMAEWRASVDGFATSAWLGAAVALLIWVARANAQARQLGAEGLDYTPGAAAGWFLVPVLNLILPASVMKEIWKASQPGTTGWSWKQRVAAPLITWWWAVWLVSFGLSWHASDAMLSAYTVEAAIRADFTMVAACVADILCTALLVLVVRDIDQAQRAKARLLPQLPDAQAL